MIKISVLTESIKRDLLELLYKDEVCNSIMIELIQNTNQSLGELYINETSGKITELLHVKYDGNSYFTNFLYSSSTGLNSIAEKITELGYDKTLIAGKSEEVSILLKLMNNNKSINPNVFFKLNFEMYKEINTTYQCKIRLANYSYEDLKAIKKFTARFFEAESQAEVEAVTNTEKILEKMKKGIYLLEHNNETIGMARFAGKTDNYAEITSVYIDEVFRGKGFGREIIAHMVELSLIQNKTPVLATALNNAAAMRTYESLGFERIGEYAFEFLD